MTTRQQLYDGKAKTIFSGPDDQHLIQYFKDDATAYNALKHDVIKGKGVLNNLISEYIMGIMADSGVTTHFVKRLDEREQLIRKVSIIPIEVVVRNIAAGSLVKRLGGTHIPLQTGDHLPKPMVEFYLKEDALNDPIISADHVTTFGLTTDDELNHIIDVTLSINKILGVMFKHIGITLIDFKLEFGRLEDNSIILADEISPDNCRLWDTQTGEKKDKDRFREDLGGLIDAYSDIAQRLGIDLSLLKNA